jgi:DNA-binding FadR family transcriptional regulator
VRDSSEIRREALHDTIQARIERFIIESGARPGDPLPPQQEMARALGISVPSLREAMKSLEALGMIDVRHGAGTYVGSFSLDAMVDGLAFRVRLDAGDNARILSELLEVRMILEQAYVRRVVDHTDDEHIAALYAIVAEMDALAAADCDFPAEDWHFHEVLYRPINNALLTKLVRAFWDVVEVVKADLLVAPISTARTAFEHRKIVDAIAASDPDGAAQAMGDHFHGVRLRLEQSSDGGALLGTAITNPTDKRRPGGVSGIRRDEGI